MEGPREESIRKQEPADQDAPPETVRNLFKLYRTCQQQEDARNGTTMQPEGDALPFRLIEKDGVMKSYKNNSEPAFRRSAGRPDTRKTADICLFPPDRSRLRLIVSHTVRAAPTGLDEADPRGSEEDDKKITTFPRSETFQEGSQTSEQKRLRVKELLAGIRTRRFPGVGTPNPDDPDDDYAS